MTSGFVYDIAVSGDYAYVADSDNGLVIVDVSSKSAPTLAGSYNTAGYAGDVAVSGDYAYVADGSNGLVIVDITDKSAPALAGGYDTAGSAYGVTVSGEYAYVAAGWNGLVIVDVTDKTAPMLAGRYNTTGYSAYGVAVSGDYAYVTDGYNGLVVDITDKSAPVLAGSYDTVGCTQDVAVSGDYAYVADWDNGLVIVDISSKTAPALAGGYDTAGCARGAAVSGDYAYVAGHHNGLVIVDVTDKSAPTLAGRYNTAGYAYGVAVSGDYAYVADASNGLVIVDISSKTAPALAGSYDTAGAAYGVAVSGDYAYVAGGDNGLVIVDVTDKSAPTLAGRYDTTGCAYGVAVSGDYAYVADASNGLVIVDISSKTAPALAGSYDTAGQEGVTVSGDYAYVANWYTGLVIVDITDKSAPVLAGSYDTAGGAESVAVSGDYAYVADSSNGLVILRMDSTPKRLSVELYFDKEYFDTESRTIKTKSHVTGIEAGDKLKGYAKTTLTSGDYTVKTYIKMIMPDGTEKYAYSTSSPFCPEYPLNFSDTKVSFRPDTWEAETKLWNWDIYKMTGTEPEGDYTWEFWYEDATTGEVLASSTATYTFSRTTELLQEGRHKYFVRISNIDDDGIVYVNGDEVASATFNGNSGWVEISDKLLYDGENDIRFNVTNHPERYPENWTYKFELSTFTDESKIIWEDSCGSVGSKSCNNNQNTGEVYNKTVKLTIAPLFTRETVDYGGNLNLYSINHNDNPANPDYMVVISPLLAQAFVAEEMGSQEKIDDKANQIEEALTAVRDVHPNAYIYFRLVAN